MKIGQIGQRIDFFWSTIINEAELLERFGIQVLPIDLVDMIRTVRKRTEANRPPIAGNWRSSSGGFASTTTGRRTTSSTTSRSATCCWSLAQRHDLDGFAVQTFNSIPNELGSFLKFGLCLVADAGYPVGAGIGPARRGQFGAARSGRRTRRAVVLPDLTIRHPKNDNAVLLWHADAPLRLRAAELPGQSRHALDSQGLAHRLVHFQLKDGPLTFCRFEGDGDGYRLGCGEGRTVPGPYTQEFYTWMEVDDWPTWERQLVYGPYIHHCSCVYDHFADVLEEAARYIPHLQFERFGNPSRRHP